MDGLASPDLELFQYTAHIFEFRSTVRYLGIEVDDALAMPEIPGQADMLCPPSNRRSCAKNRKSRRFDMDKASEASLVTHRPPSGPDEPHARQHGYAFLSLRRQALHQPLAAPKLIGPFPAAVLSIQ